MQILDGKLTAKHYKNQLKAQVDILIAAKLTVPHLAAVLVGNSGASETYVASKVKNCAEIGYNSTLIRHNDTVTEAALLQTITTLNNDATVHGILVQLPLPAHINTEAVINAIKPCKDVDGFHPISIGRMVSGVATYLPATPYGIMLLLKHYNIVTKGKHAVIIGRSNIVGTPISILLSRNSNPGNCTVTLVHSHTTNIPALCLQADIIVAALGKPNYLTAAMVKPGAVVIDVGITRIPDAAKKSGFTLVGDVDYAAVAPLCSYITPVPGGVGPMTIAALLMNTMQAYKHGLPKVGN